MIITLIYCLLILVIIGVVLYFVELSVGPIPRPIKLAVGVIVLIIMLLWVLGAMPGPRWGRVP